MRLVLSPAVNSFAKRSQNGLARTTPQHSCLFQIQSLVYFFILALLTVVVVSVLILLVVILVLVGLRVGVVGVVWIIRALIVLFFVRILVFLLFFLLFGRLDARHGDRVVFSQWHVLSDGSGAGSHDDFLGLDVEVWATLLLYLANEIVIVWDLEIFDSTLKSDVNLH